MKEQLANIRSQALAAIEGAADPAARLNRMKLTLGGVAREVPLPGGELAGRSVRVEF